MLNIKTLRTLGMVTGISFLFFFSILIGYLIGNFFDKLLNTGPYLMLIFVFLGIIAGFKECASIIKNVIKELKKNG